VALILLDIEGTTTPIDFVTGTLVPYARAHLRAHLARHVRSPHGLALFEAIRREHAADAEAHAAVPVWNETGPDTLSSVEAYLLWLMDRDRKSPALKELQGYIWEHGYETSALIAPVYPDVEPAFVRWRAEGHTLGIFSSGSVLAQQWLFRRSTAGDLTAHLQWYFDTQTGPKREPASYASIAAVTDTPPAEILFVSDVTAELDAGRSAGMRTALVVRPGNPPQPAHTHQTIRRFDELSLLRRPPRGEEEQRHR
jgi:enolase-phosphatase E1